MENINCKAILTNTETTSTIMQTEVHVQEKRCEFQQLVRKGTTRECHRYGKTHGFEVTGLAGMGTVVNFGTLRHTTYPYRGIAGMYGYITVG